MLGFANPLKQPDLHHSITLSSDASEYKPTRGEVAFACERIRAGGGVLPVPVGGWPAVAASGGADARGGVGPLGAPPHGGVHTKAGAKGDLRGRVPATDNLGGAAGPELLQLHKRLCLLQCIELEI